MAVKSEPEALKIWPRQYAHAINMEHDINERRRMLADVPEYWREWVKHYVIDYAERKKCN